MKNKNTRSQAAQNFTVNASLTFMKLSLVLCLAHSSSVAEAQPRGAERLLRPGEAASLFDKLPSEKQIPELDAFVVASEKLRGPDCFPVTTRDGQQLRVAIHHRGSGTNNRVVVLIHGVMADHAAWRYVAGELGRDYDLWLTDLPGCGASEKPHPKSLAPDGYSPTAMAERILQALKECSAERSPPPRFTLAAHSLGGMVVLRMLGDPDLRQRYASVLKQIDGIVLLAPCDVGGVNHEIPTFKTIVDLKTYQVAVGNALGIVKDAAAQSDLDGFCERARVTREGSERLATVLATGDSRRAAQAMLRQAVPWRVKEHRPDWEGIARLEAQYQNIDVPCLIVWGQRDETLPVTMGYKLATQIRTAKLVVLPNCMHSIELEQPSVCARIIRDFDVEVVAKSFGHEGSRFALGNVPLPSAAQ